MVTSVSPVGLADRQAGTVSFTTSLGFPRKLERVLRDPHVSLAYHTREHGFADGSSYVLVQGNASVDLRPSQQRLTDLLRAGEPFLGKAKRGPVWDWLLREYHQERVFVDVKAERVALWPDLSAGGAMAVTGSPWPVMPDEQKPPKNGTGPRVDITALARRIDRLPHRVLAYRGADGFPVILPVRITGRMTPDYAWTLPAACCRPAAGGLGSSPTPSGRNASALVCGHSPGG